MQHNFSTFLLILHANYFYNRLRFEVVIDKSCRGHFFPDTVYDMLTHFIQSMNREFIPGGFFISGNFERTSQVPGNYAVWRYRCG